MRGAKKLVALGGALAQLVTSLSLAGTTQLGLETSQREPYFSKDVLGEARALIAHHVGLSASAADDVSPGQPFHLRLMEGLLQSTED